MITSGNRRVVFIDSRAPDIQSLISGVQPRLPVIAVDPNSDGVQQVAEFPAANDLHGLSAINIVSHSARDIALHGNCRGSIGS